MTFCEPTKVPTQHQVAFYCNDHSLLEGLTQFIETALRIENSTIVISTASNRDSLLIGLQKCGLHIGAAIEHGKYIALDAAAVLATIMVDGHIDEFRFFTLFDDLVRKAAEAARQGPCRVAMFADYLYLLWAQGNAEAVIEAERLGNQLAATYDLQIVCGYSLKSFQGGVGSHIFERICAEHSAIQTW